MSVGTYTPDYFAAFADTSLSSAQRLMPIVLDVVSARTAVDIGCGSGAWTRAMLDLGIDATGIDGDYVDRSKLLIPAERFVARDLSSGSFELDGTFDLAISVEVAEHLPEPSAAAFVERLTTLAPVVLFSAAIPHQGGNHHINEQWQSYWRALFAARGYAAYDVVRPAIWDEPSVDSWYAQNALVYSREPLDAPAPVVTDVVHPRLYEQHHTPSDLTMRDMLKAARDAASRMQATRRISERYRRLTSR